MESLKDKISDRNAAIFFLIGVIIILLLFWRKSLTVNQSAVPTLPPLDLPSYDFVQDGLKVPAFNDFDWGQTTDMMCGCGDDFSAGSGPILSPPTYIYVQAPPVPHIEMPALAQLPPAPTFDLPVYQAPPPPTWHVEYGKNVHGEQELYHVGSDGLVMLMGKYSRKGPFPSQTKNVVPGSGTDLFVDGTRYVHDASADHPAPVGFNAGKKAGTLDNAGQLESPVVYSSGPGTFVSG